MSSPKTATHFTTLVNQALYNDPKLNWEDQEDFDFASRGLIAKLADPIILDGQGQPVWDLNQYGCLAPDKAPPTVNPSLWRQARLNMHHGLFKVSDRLYQVRGYDLSVISFIEGDTGWIVIDPLISTETARAALELVYQHVAERPVVAVIYTHSHVDHFGGVKGVVSEAAVEAGEVQILAPEGFMEAAVSENILAGTAMSRRALYMYGNLIPTGVQGQVDAGLGKTTSSGTITLIAPTHFINQTGTKRKIDGVEIEFQVTPGTEAPAEMNFYFPQFRALCMAENCSHNLHNLLTLRGAQVRDAKAWAYYIDEAIECFSHRSDLVFTSHHWPVWGGDRLLEYLKKQRDMYKYLHDQSLRLMNLGHTMIEVAEMMELPKSLASAWYSRGYYGSVNHNAKSVYQKYLGWYDGNPANLHPLPPVEASKKYVEFMGGADAVVAKARECFNQGDYRWVAQVVNHVVFAEPNHEAARQLQADTLEQLGYQAESAPWRNFYLTGAKELRDGIVPLPFLSGAGRDLVKSITLDMFFDFLAVRLNGPKAEGQTITLKLLFTDTNQQYLLKIENSVLNYWSNKPASPADITLTLTRELLNQLAMRQYSAGPSKPLSTLLKVMKKINHQLPRLLPTILNLLPREMHLYIKQIKIDGDLEKLITFFSLFDTFDPWFNIVTP